MLLASSAGVYYWKLRGKPNDDFVQIKILTPESYKEVSSKIRESFNTKYWIELKISRDQRRRTAPASQEYQVIIMNFQRTIKRILDESTLEILGFYRIERKVFEESVNFYDNDIELREFGMNLIKPLPIEFNRVKLTSDQTKQILCLFNARLKERNPEYAEVDEYLVITSQIEDEIYKEYKIEMEEFNAAVEKYKSVVNDIVEEMKLTTSAIIASSENSY